MQKRHSKPQKSTGRKRHNLSLDETVRKRGETLAERDNRSFSNFVEKLIDDAWKRENQVSQAAA